MSNACELSNNCEAVYLSFFMLNLLTNLLIVFTSAGVTYYLIYRYREYQRRPTVENIYRLLRQYTEKRWLSPDHSEQEVEKILARLLGRHFGKVNTQYSLGSGPGAQERIDIDINEGQLGIEIKLATWLRRANERNRLLGQMDLYKERQYRNNNLMVLVVGEEKMEHHKKILELKKILENKGIPFYYLVVK